MANTRTDQQFKLQDGRMLGYAECWTLADAIPNCNARFYEKEEHLTLTRSRIREVLSTLGW